MHSSVFLSAVKSGLRGDGTLPLFIEDTGVEMRLLGLLAGAVVMEDQMRASRLFCSSTSAHNLRISLSRSLSVKGRRMAELVLDEDGFGVGCRDQKTLNESV